MIDSTARRINSEQTAGKIGEEERERERVALDMEGSGTQRRQREGDRDRQTDRHWRLGGY